MCILPTDCRNFRAVIKVSAAYLFRPVDLLTTMCACLQDALYSAVVETRSTMLDTLRRVPWSPGTTPAVASLEERLRSQCAHSAPVDTHCGATPTGDPVQLSYGMLAQARELLQTLVDHVESAQGSDSGRHALSLTSDVKALQVQFCCFFL
jgi:hypothetical protein